MWCLVCAVVQAETMARGNAGVNAGRAVVRAVLNDDAGAVRRSVAGSLGRY